MTTAYAGFDATADKLHEGHFAILDCLSRYSNPIILIGGATTRIGDFTGKKESRRKLSESEISHNINEFRKTFRKILPKAKIVDNYDWWKDVNYLDFITEYKFPSLNELLKKKFITNRINQNELAYSEFLYPLMQAYDFLHLYKTYNCCVQIGGSDQWGNISIGIDFVRRNAGVVLDSEIIPLVLDKNGNKISKSS